VTESHLPIALEDRLRALGREMNVQLGERDLTSAVLANIAQHRPANRRRDRRRILVMVAAIVVALVLTATAAAAVRAFFDIGTIRIFQDGAALGPIPSGTALKLGTQVTLREARARSSVGVPTTAGLQHPDEVWFDDVGGGQVTLLYRARAGLPPANHTDGIGLLVQEIAGNGSQSLGKHLSSGTQAQLVTVHGSPGVFLSGADHALYYHDPSGTSRYDRGRLAGRALIFQRGAQTVRIEGSLSLKRMLEVATSLR
jgi:hypothetical protein